MRKLLNVAGSAAITYGLLNPEKVKGLEMLAATLGPLLASMFSWIDNSSDDDPDGGPPTYLWILAGAVILFLPSCADLTINASTPYGDISTDAKGHVIVSPKPIVIPQK